MNRRAALTLLAGLLVAGCGGGGGDSLPPAVTRFLEPQKLPKRRPGQLVEIADGVALFDVEYGEPTGCPARCSWAAGMGLMNRGKIGWLWIDETDLPAAIRPRYAFTIEDSYLFSGDFLVRLKAATQTPERIDTDFGFAYSYLRDLIARSDQADHDALVRIALDFYGEPLYFLAEVLLANPLARTDRDVLNLVAHIPGNSDGYSHARQTALDLLSGLP